MQIIVNKKSDLLKVYIWKKFSLSEDIGVLG